MQTYREKGNSLRKNQMNKDAETEICRDTRGKVMKLVWLGYKLPKRKNPIQCVWTLFMAALG